MRCSMLLSTRAMIAPTVRHATLNNSHVADLDVRTANHAANMSGFGAGTGRHAKRSRVARSESPGTVR